VNPNFFFNLKSSFSNILIIRGAAYLVMIAYDNEKLILTQDDNLPMLEIDDHYQLTTLQNDMQFLIKVNYLLISIFNLKYNFIDKYELG
jgi:hypothetical protein